jgi:hypothetical protein
VQRRPGLFSGTSGTPQHALNLAWVAKADLSKLRAFRCLRSVFPLPTSASNPFPLNLPDSIGQPSEDGNGYVVFHGNSIALQITGHERREKEWVTS